jgi:hypothetical protein
MVRLVFGKGRHCWVMFNMMSPGSAGVSDAFRHRPMQIYCEMIGNIMLDAKSAGKYYHCKYRTRP